MTAIRVPKSVLARVERHLRGAKQPLLYGPRAETDTPLRALPGDHGRFALMIEPESSWGAMFLLAAVGRGEEMPSGDTIIERLTRGAVAGLAGVPTHFTDESGRVIAMWLVEEGVPTVYGPMALSLLAWALAGRRKRTGLFIRLGDG